jgi:hypothetical protein
MRTFARQRVIILVGLVLLLAGIAWLTVGEKVVFALLPTQSYQSGDLKVTAWSTGDKRWLDGVNIDITIVNGRNNEHHAGVTDSDGVAWKQVLVGTATIHGHKYRYKDVTVTAQTQPNTLTTVQLNFASSQTPGPLDFSIGINGFTSVQQGQSISLGVTLYMLSGSSFVKLSMNGCNKGLNCSFDVKSGIPTFQSNLNIFVSASAPTGTRSLQVVGEGGGVTKRTAFYVNVQPALESSGFSLSPTYSTTSIQQHSHSENAINVSSVTGYVSRRAEWAQSNLNYAIPCVCAP